MQLVFTADVILKANTVHSFCVILLCIYVLLYSYDVLCMVHELCSSQWHSV
jgi:hypothetical protein